jgi:uncharacterized delta-60 repeat protein
MSFGIYTYDLGGSNDSISKCLIQSDGKIILIGTAFGNFTAIKLSGFGVLDKNFGTNGVATTDFGGNDIALSGSIQQDGKLLISGSSSWGTPSSDLALVRLLANGNTDTSFGVNGKVSIDFAQYDTADSVSLQPDGRIFIGGHSYYKNNDDFIGVRLNTNGSLDSTFGFGGLTNTDLGSGDFGYSTLVLTDKSLLIAGRSGGAFAVVKYVSNGQLDSTFGQSGKSILGYFGASDTVKIAISPIDGKIYLAGDTLAGVNRDFAILRLNANGSIDTSFGNQGRATYDFNGRNDYLSDVLVTTEGKVILTGSSSGDFSALRINSDGNLDLSFGTNGQLVTDIGGINDTSYGAALQSDGKLVIAGSSNGNFAAVRYSSIGVLDQTFGNLPTYVLNANNTTVDEGKIVAITLTTQYLDAGTIVPYVVSGISSSDLTSGVLSGSFTTSLSGQSTILLAISNDQLSEGTETIIFQAGGSTIKVIINDTSKSPLPIVVEETHLLAVIVDKGVIDSSAVYLKNLIEKVTYTNGLETGRTIEYNGIKFDYAQVDPLITTVLRDSEFTTEFTNEINDFVQSDLNIKYKVAVALIGTANIDGVILSIAGADGNYIA